MKKLTFDQNGYLQPYEPIEVDLATFEHNFVTAFPNSQTRSKLFDNYLRFLYRFQDDIFPFFEQWIDGSFVTQKENPNDIDLVTFLDYDIWELKGDKAIDQFYSFSLERERIDSYLVKVAPKGHIDYVEYLEKTEYQKKLYSSTKPIEKMIYPKGFLKLKFEK